MSQASSVERVRVTFVMPTDPERMRIGGINSFLRGFVKFAPADFDIEIVGISADRALWRWHDVTFEDRPIRLLPVVRWQVGVRSRIPIAVRFVAALLRGRSRLATSGRVLSFHRPGTDLPFLRSHAPRWRVVHLSVEDLATEGSESRWRRLPAVLRRLERTGFRRADRIYVVNESAADDYRRAFPDVASRIEFLPNWADGTLFHPFPDERRGQLRAAVDAELGLEGGGPLILWAGRLEGQKDPMLMARAFADVRGQVPNAALLMVGEGTLDAALRAELARTGSDAAARVLTTVPRERLAELMNTADAFAITSAFETGPTVGLEALACGLPVVTTPVGEVSRLVAESGAGQVSEAATPAAVASALAATLGQPSAAIRERSLAAAAPRLATEVLGRLYDTNRQLAARARQDLGVR
ncbi:MAG TPA: glycosyltransferase family 4 protein [Candidatus Limnocylindria bacterium]|nr:glycosyltransferase family 4 protein [Candidatus Limnocylindria bacterium]